MLKKRFIRPFRQLRGKLTISYTLTAVTTFLLIEIIFITIVFLVISFNVPFFVLNALKQETPQAVPFFVHSVPDREALTVWLRVSNASFANQGPLNGHLIFLAVVDARGQTVASIGSHPVPVDTPIQGQLSAQNRANFQSVLNDVKGRAGTVDREADGILVATAPVVGEKGNVQGALVMKVTQPDLLQIFSTFVLLIALSAVGVTTIAAITGTVSGYLTARGFIRRLKELSDAADRWSRGNFSIPTYDASEDELGQTKRQLNRMAEQLQNLLQTRQKLATLEERNRLARELHDSVKQQVFAVGMQLGATKVLLKRDVNAAEARLNEAEKLVQQAQQELTSLIRELRPVALEGKGLVAALRELATQWTKQTDIVANVRIENKSFDIPRSNVADGFAIPRGNAAAAASFAQPLGSESPGFAQERGNEVQPLSLTVEEALYRVVQEALANVARHSKATLVQLTLTTTEDTVTLSVADNGQGFDATQQTYLGVGLHSMQERLKALGGIAQVESTPGKGTRIVASCKRLGVDINNPVVSAYHEQA